MKQLFRSFFSFSPSLWGRGPGGEALRGLGGALILLFLFSCTQDLVQPSPSDGQTVPVRLSIATAPMQEVGEPLTRATTDKTNDELAVHKTWVLQFNGNTAASRLLKAEEVTFTNNTLETELLHTDATCRLYVVANSDCAQWAADAAAGNGISLADFEASVAAFAATKTIDPGKGLPMAACQDFNPRTDAPAAAFTLKPLVAKLTFKLNIDPDFTGFTVNAITLKQIVNGATYKETAAGEAAVRPAGAAYAGELDLTGADASAVTCYLPENLSGKNPELKYMSERGRANAPEKATYVEVAGVVANGDEYAYSFFLGDGTAADFNVARNVHYNLTATLNGTNVADERTEITLINLNSGRETANCYLVYENNMEYFFDATVMGNGATTAAGSFPNSYDIVPQPLAPKSAKVLWETGTVQGAVVSSVQLSADKTKVRFTTGSTAGNAVIAVYDNVNPEAPGAKILWSWHVWKPETKVIDLPYQKYVDNTGILKTADNYRMMDRNLGATVTNTVTTRYAGWGLFYQWGRKDPFPEGGGQYFWGDAYQPTVPSLSTGQYLNNRIDPSTLSLSNNAACIAYAIEHPTTFLMKDGLADWLINTQDNLWGNPKEGTKEIYTTSSLMVNSGYGSKSIYDPCPVGYRVPPSDTFTALLQSDGTLYGDGKNDDRSKYDRPVWSSTSMSPSGVAFSFPTSGCINNMNGYLGFITNFGWYWLSSPSCSGGGSYEHTAARLYFTGSGVDPELYNSRTTGCVVRCVRE